MAKKSKKLKLSGITAVHVMYVCAAQIVLMTDLGA